MSTPKYMVSPEGSLTSYFYFYGLLPTITITIYHSTIHVNNISIITITDTITTTITMLRVYM